jgi:hypothetical protein
MGSNVFDDVGGLYPRIPEDVLVLKMVLPELG